MLDEIKFESIKCIICRSRLERIAYLTSSFPIYEYITVLQINIKKLNIMCL